MDDLSVMEDGLSEDMKMTLFYIAGYVVKDTENDDDSKFYYTCYGKYFNCYNRGGLTIPGDSAVQWITLAIQFFATFQTIFAEHLFLQF